MNLKKLVKMLEAETDMEKAAEVLRKIDSLIIRKGVLRMGPFGYLHPLELESHICKRNAFKDYFDCDTWGYKWGYPVRKDCIYIQPGYAGIEIVLSINEQYVVSCIIKKRLYRAVWKRHKRSECGSEANRRFFQEGWLSTHSV